MLALIGSSPAMRVGRTALRRDFRSRCRKTMHAEHADNSELNVRSGRMIGCAIRAGI
jgi:hypothetical protein